MPLALAAQAELCRLRRTVAEIEGRFAGADRLVLDPAAGLPAAPAATGLRSRPRQGRLKLGVRHLDALMGGGLPLATLHEIRAAQSRDGGAAAGFIMALATRLAAAGGASSLLWISEADARHEAGELYAPGLAALGLDPAIIVEIATRTQSDALWAFEAALACPGVGLAVCELRQASLDLSTTRRCALRARNAGVTGLLLRLNTEAETSAAELRFRLSSAPATTIGRFDAGIGRMAWNLTLEKSRIGPTGAFMVEWNAYDRSFAEYRAGDRDADSQPVSATPPHRPAYPPAQPGFRYAS